VLPGAPASTEPETRDGVADTVRPATPENNCGAHGDHQAKPHDDYQHLPCQPSVRTMRPLTGRTAGSGRVGTLKPGGNTHRTRDPDRDLSIATARHTRTADGITVVVIGQPRPRDSRQTTL